MAERKWGSITNGATFEALADEYLLEIEQGQPNANAEKIRTLLRWVALVETVNRKDDTAVKLTGEPCGLTALIEVRARLAALVLEHVVEVVDFVLHAVGELAGVLDSQGDYLRHRRAPPGDGSPREAKRPASGVGTGQRPCSPPGAMLKCPH